MRTNWIYSAKIFLVILLQILLSFQTKVRAQEINKKPDHTYQPLVLKLNEEGSKYVRFILWNQVWVTSNNLADKTSKFQLSTSIRRSRFIAYAQLSPQFLILTHWGLNSLDGGNLSSLGNTSDAPQLFLHGAWTEFKVSEMLYVGGGLHYWNGLTRLASASTLNFLTLDQSRPFVHWHSLGITDQFGRHLGLYTKGQIGRFDYRLALNTPGRHPLGNGQDYGQQSSLTYTGVSTPTANGAPTGNTIVAGYFRYQCWDQESIKLPYQVGAYLGQKKVLAIGAGFFAHPDGMYDTETGQHHGVSHLAVDGFMDLPTRSGSLNAYLALLNFNYGKRYMSRWAGTGSAIYGQAGYYLQAARLMPYLAYQSGQYEAYQKRLNALDIGLNVYINGHNAKLTFEYHHIGNNPLEGGLDAQGRPVGTSQLRVQAQVFL